MIRIIRYITAAMVFLLEETCLVESLVVYTGDQAILDCSLTESLPKWRKKISPHASEIYTNQDSKQINPYLPHKDRLAINNEGSLLINDTEISDAGNYACSYAGLGEQVVELIVIVKPGLPFISNTETFENGKTIVRGKEDQNVTLTCISRGGYPEQTVKWTTESSGLQSTKIAEITSDGTYTVTIEHIFVAERLHDRITYFCKSELNGYEATASVMLYLSLKPSQPAITGFSTISENSIGIFQCKTGGCRPQASISWQYNGKTFSTPVSSNYDKTSETYTIESNYSSVPLQRIDNHKLLVCVVSHEALIANIEQSHALNITFPPVSVTLSGNTQIVANGVNLLELTCTSSTANPAANLRWQQGQTAVIGGIARSIQQGHYGGKVVSERLTLKPTRHMDGDIILCAYNSVVKEEIALNLTYNTILSVPRQVNATESEPNVILRCSADSKPPSTFKWFKIGLERPVYTGTGSADNNVLDYIIPVVNRSNAGQYRCEAHNGLGTPDKTNSVLELNVFYPPDVSVYTKNSTINDSAVTLLCSASGHPSTYTYSEWTHTWPGHSDILKTYPSDHQLFLTNLSYTNTGMYHCAASNGVKQRNTQQLFIRGSAYLLLKSFPIVTVPNLHAGEIHNVLASFKHPLTLTIQLYSNGDTADKLSIKLLDNSSNTVHSSLIEMIEGDITLRIYGQDVHSRGIHLNVTHTITRKAEYGKYFIHITNDIGTTVIPFQVSPQGVPAVPTHFKVLLLHDNSAILYWIKGFNGGYHQHFLIQIAETTTDTWENVTTVSEYDQDSSLLDGSYIAKITDLPPGAYDVRLLAVNKLGFSKSAELSSPLTIPEKVMPVDEKHNSGVVGGAIGGGVGVFGIFCAVITGVIFYRKGLNQMKIRLATSQFKPSDFGLTEMDGERSGTISHDQGADRSDLCSYETLDGSRDEQNAYTLLQDRVINEGHRASTTTTSAYEQVLPKKSSGNIASETDTRSTEPVYSNAIVHA